MEAFCCHGNQSFDPVCPKTLCSLSPTPVMLHIKFDQDWPTGFRDIQVWKCGRRTTTTDDDDGRRTTDGPLVYYKLTLWAFGSGELIKPEDHWSCIAHLSAEDMLKSAVIEEKKFKHSPRIGADNSFGPKFWYQQEGLITMVICCKFKKNIFNLWLYTYLFMI